MHLKLRDATADDLALLQHWDNQPHTIESDPNDDWNWEVELRYKPDWREQLIAEFDATPIGFIQIIDPSREESGYWGDAPPNLRAIDIWIGEKENLGKGFGTMMMKAVVERCFAERSVKAILIDPWKRIPRLIGFMSAWDFSF